MKTWIALASLVLVSCCVQWASGQQRPTWLDSVCPKCGADLNARYPSHRWDCPWRKDAEAAADAARRLESIAADARREAEREAQRRADQAERERKKAEWEMKRMTEQIMRDAASAQRHIKKAGEKAAEDAFWRNQQEIRNADNARDDRASQARMREFENDIKQGWTNHALDLNAGVPSRLARLGSVAKGVIMDYVTDPANIYGGVDPVGVALNNMDMWPDGFVNRTLVAPILQASNGVAKQFEQPNIPPALSGSPLWPGNMPSRAAWPAGNGSSWSPTPNPASQAPGVTAPWSSARDDSAVARAAAEAAQARETKEILGLLNGTSAGQSVPTTRPNETAEILKLLGTSSAQQPSTSPPQTKKPSDVPRAAPRAEPSPAARNDNTAKVMDLLNPTPRR